MARIAAVGDGAPYEGVQKNRNDAGNGYVSRKPGCIFQIANLFLFMDSSLDYQLFRS